MARRQYAEANSRACQNFLYSLSHKPEFIRHCFTIFQPQNISELQPYLSDFSALAHQRCRRRLPRVGVVAYPILAVNIYEGQDAAF